MSRVSTIRSPRWASAVLLGVLALGCAATEADDSKAEDGSEQVATAVQELTEYAPIQEKVDALYAYDNIVTINVEMSDEQWAALKTEVPNPNPPGCTAPEIDATTGEAPSRYVWRDTTRVTVSGSKSITLGQTFTDVKIRKKSYCGSASTSAEGKPSLKLKFPTAANAVLGLQYLDLNNSQQDPSFVRQTLGYYLFGLAGLPHSRANYAKVRIVTPTKTEEFVHINVEPLRASFIGNPANQFTNRTITQSGKVDAKAPGNIYELPYPNDITPNGLKYIGVENVSAIAGPSRPDLTYAANMMSASPTPGAVSSVINLDQFFKFWAMEVLLKHADGYTQNVNNVYVYNDSVATSGTQSDATVDFKFIPWGIDMILKPDWQFNISTASKPGQILRSASVFGAKFAPIVGTLRDTVFSRNMLEGTIKTRIDTLQSQLLSLGLPASTVAEIEVVRKQLKLSRAACIKLAGLGTASAYVVDSGTGDVLRASTLEPVPNTSYYEVYHRQPLSDGAERWIFGTNSVGTTLRSEGYGRNLYASPNLRTTANNPYIFPVVPGTSPTYEAWNLEYQGNSYTFDGTFSLKNLGTGGYAHYSAVLDVTPQGRLRVYQGPATPLVLY